MVVPPKLSCHLSVKWDQLLGNFKAKTTYSVQSHNKNSASTPYTLNLTKNSGLSFWEFPVESTVHCIFKKEDNHIEYTKNIWKCLTRNFFSSWFSSQNLQNFTGSMNTVVCRSEIFQHNFWILQETIPGNLYSIHTCSKVPKFLV